jgi:Cu-Zn family superoxide dismutase
MLSRLPYARTLAAGACGAVLLLAGCIAPRPQGVTATADLEPTRGNRVNGSVRFVQVGDVVRVSGTVRGLAPNSEHGFHIHETGDCSGGDAMRAGGHFNPRSGQHGHFGMAGTHAGDLPSLHADATGVATFSAEAHLFTVGSGEADIVGRSLVVHQDADDYISQPAGNSGARLACAVIVRR